MGKSWGKTMEKPWEIMENPWKTTRKARKKPEKT